MGQAFSCYMVEPAGAEARIYLRRVCLKADQKCPGRPGLAHEAIFELGKGQVDSWCRGGDLAATFRDGRWPAELEKIPRSDPRWPRKCQHCDYQFEEGSHPDMWQHSWDRLYRRLDTGEVCTMDQMPPGAMWYDDDFFKHFGYKGPDGHSLVVKLPGGTQWCVDSQANNCTRKGDKVHQCWPRRGEPPRVTVDKSFGPTCSAGAGSIAVREWHGFLRDGKLVPC